MCVRCELNTEKNQTKYSEGIPSHRLLQVKKKIEPTQPLGIISGLKETSIQRYIVERTNKAELRSEEQSEKTESCRENLLNEIQLKGPYRQKQTRAEQKGVGKLSWFMSDINHNIPTT